MIQQMLAIWSLIPLPFLNPAWTSGSSQFTHCWSLAWRILSITLLACKMSAGEGNGTPLQYSCLENPMDVGAWWAIVHGVAKSRTRLSDFTLTFHFHALEKEMATHSSVLAWRIPGTGEPGGVPSMGSHRVGHDWSDLAAAAGQMHCWCCELSPLPYYLFWTQIKKLLPIAFCQPFTSSKIDKK